MDAARLLDEALAAWAYARAGVIDEVENLPADRWGFRPARSRGAWRSWRVTWRSRG
jgi:hypothetical protein